MFSQWQRLDCVSFIYSWTIPHLTKLFQLHEHSCFVSFPLFFPCFCSNSSINTIYLCKLCPSADTQNIYGQLKSKINSNTNKKSSFSPRKMHISLKFYAKVQSLSMENLLGCHRQSHHVSQFQTTQ